MYIRLGGSVAMEALARTAPVYCGLDNMTWSFVGCLFVRFCGSCIVACGKHVFMHGVVSNRLGAFSSHDC